MPNPVAVQGYSSLTQQIRLCLENNGTGEQLLMPQTAGASTMSLTTQPNTLSPTTGMHLHFFIIGNPAAGSIIITGTLPTGGAQTSQTYHVPVAPQQAQGYTEFTTKEVWGTVGASGIALTTLTPCQIIVFGSWGGKYLLPITIDPEEKITHHAPSDKRGILAKNLRVVQLTKGTDITKLDSDLYPDSLWAYYMAIGPNPTITTVPSVPATLLAATTKAATMTLTTAPTAPGMFLIITPGANSLAGTVVLSGLDQFGNPATETITVGANNNPVYSTKRYSALTSPGTNQFTTTGLSVAATLAVTGVYAWKYAWIYDGINNLTPYAATLENYNGVNGIILPGTILTDFVLDWQKEKEILLQTKGQAQDYLVVGDPTSLSVGTNPFSTLPQPTSLPYTAWPGTFYIDTGTGTPFTTQDGSFLTYKFNVMTGRKWNYAGDGMQRPAYVTWDGEPDYTIDAEIIDINYQNYVNFFKTNMPLILATTFQGALLGSTGGSTYFEQIQITAPMKVDTFKKDQSKNPVSGSLKLMSQYDFSNLGYYYQVAVTCQQPPTYTA